MSADRRSRNNVFAGLALDRHAEQRDDAEWLSGQSGDARAQFLVLAADGRALVRTDCDALRLLDAAERRTWFAHATASFLGADEHGPRFVLRVEEARAERLAAELDATWLDLRSAGLRLHPFQSGLFAYARALSHWQSRTRHCPVCGAALAIVAGGHRARCTNTYCEAEQFPRTDAAIIVIVSHEDRCLLGRHAKWAEARYSTLAGFVEPGETLEDAVRREVMEEAGVRVVDCDYHSSQPWPFPASLMVGFTARADDPTIHCGPELADARWFGVEDLRRALAERTIILPPPVSVSYRLIEHWLRETADLDLATLVNDARC